MILLAEVNLLVMGSVSQTVKTVGSRLRLLWINNGQYFILGLEKTNNCIKVPVQMHKMAISTYCHSAVAEVLCFWRASEIMLATWGQWK